MSPTDTVTDTSASSASASSAAITVTVVSAPSSAIQNGDTDSVTPDDGVSSSRIVPVAVDVAVTLVAAPETLRPTVKVSSSSFSESSVVATANVCVSPAVPAKSIAAVFPV